MEATATAPQVMPKVVGTVDLKKFEKKTKKVEHKLYGNFPLGLLPKAIGLAIEANKKIGAPNSITLSNKAKVRVQKKGGGYEFEDAPEMASIWYGCGTALLKKHFIIPLRMLETMTEYGIRRVTKGDFLHMAYGKEFYLMYVDQDGNCDITKNVRVHNGEKKEKEGIWYYSTADRNKIYFCMKFADIADNSTFNTGVAGETGYICVVAGKENI